MKKIAFTVAEVLITLGIVGVVAALTFPMLAENYQRIIVETRLKKFYNTFNQALLRSIEVNGPYDGWGYFRSESWNSEGKYTLTKDDFDASVNLYLADFLNIIQKQEVNYTNGNSSYLYYLSDGSAFSFALYNNRDTYYFPKDPERCLKLPAVDRVGVCMFYFIFLPKGNQTQDWRYHKDKGLEPWMWLWDGKSESLYDDKIRAQGCNKNENGAFCTALIMHNSWKFPSNYPRKIRY